MPRNTIVSVFIPAYNAANYLKRSVGSVLAQTYPHHEVIVVDDASPERLDAAVAAIGSDRVRLFRQDQNGGTAVALNRAIAEARGTFIARLDADDWWAPEKLDIQLRFFEADPKIDVVFSNFVGVQMSGEYGGWQGDLIAQLRERGTEPTPVAEAGFVFEQSLVPALIRYTSFMHPSTVVVRRTVFERVGLFDEALRGPEDLSMWIRLANCCRIGMVPGTLAFTEIRPDSVGRNTRRMCEHMLKLYANLPTLNPNLTPDLLQHIRRFCAEQHAALGWHCRVDGCRSEARRHYLQSLRYELRAMTLLRWLRTWWPMS